MTDEAPDGVLAPDEREPDDDRMRRLEDGSVEQYRIDTDDVSAAFEGLIAWYTDRVAGEASTEEALAVPFRNMELEPPGER